ncbi:hypothetical protein FRC03_011470, partial [Tulasnella sp. 419]
MVLDAKFIGPLESGLYTIRCAAASFPLNLTLWPTEGHVPCLRHRKTLKSPTERWLVEHGEDGYRFKNASTDLYFSIQPNKVKSLAEVYGFHSLLNGKWNKRTQVSITSNPKLVLDLQGGDRVIICDDFHGKPNQQWIFNKIADDHPPSYTRQIYLGPVPAGIYWLGQPCEAPESPDGKIVLPTQAPSTAALGASARLPLSDTGKSYAHLSAITDGPWLHQIWVLEPGRHGYRFRNVALNAYLNYIKAEPVLESSSSGSLSITEWSLAKNKDLPDWLVRPSADHNIIIGISKGDSFNKLRAKTFAAWMEEKKKGLVYIGWRFEPVEEKFLDVSFS